MEEKNEKVVEETTQETTEQVDESKFASVGDDSVVKVDLSKPVELEQDEVKEDNTDDSGVVAESENANPPQEQEEVQPEAEAQETPLEDLTSTVSAALPEAPAEVNETPKLPENIEKLVTFMEETGGDLSDYVAINKDYSDLPDSALLTEYYSKAKPHLNKEEISFLIDDNFSYDEDLDESRDIQRKKLALKEQVADAKTYLDGLKSKYYEEIGSNKTLTPEQSKAVDFFNRHNKEKEEMAGKLKRQQEVFSNKTTEVFSKDFEGFEYSTGENNLRFTVKDPQKVMSNQMDISKFVKKFLNEDNTMNDAAGYHKAMFAANNADAIATHFYEQGKADAIKANVTNAKNIDMEPRQSHEAPVSSGIKFKVLGESSSDFKFKIKNK